MSIDTVLQITEKDKLVVRSEFSLTEKEINNQVEILKEWLKKQPHLPQNNDNQFLRTMLHNNKYSIEKTKKKLDTYYSIRNLFPEIFINRGVNDSSIIQIMKLVTILPMPQLTPDGYRVLFLTIIDDSMIYNPNDYLKIVFAVYDIRSYYDFCLGDHLVIDFKHSTIKQASQWTPPIIRKFYTILQTAFSDRIKGLHILNASSFINPMLVVINAVLSKKLAARVHNHKSIESLTNMIPKEILPNEYNGTAGPFLKIHENWEKFFRSKTDWIEEIGRKKSDESKRIGESFINSELLGISGSFRTLNVD